MRGLLFAAVLTLAGCDRPVPVASKVVEPPSNPALAALGGQRLRLTVGGQAASSEGEWHPLSRWCYLELETGAGALFASAWRPGSKFGSVTAKIAHQQVSIALERSIHWEPQHEQGVPEAKRVVSETWSLEGTTWTEANGDIGLSGSAVVVATFADATTSTFNLRFRSTPAPEVDREDEQRAYEQTLSALSSKVPPPPFRHDEEVAEPAEEAPEAAPD